MIHKTLMLRVEQIRNELAKFALVAVLVLSGHAHAGLVINLDFSNFSVDAPSDGDAILGGGSLAEAQGVITEAAKYWERAFANSASSISWSSNIGGVLTQNISVGWAGLSGNTLATGGTNWFLSDGRWGSGSLTWDNDGSSTFFVDSTPTESSEWNSFSERDSTFNGVNVNSERVYYNAPAGVVRDNTDMMTVAIHEVGHALGFLGAFPAYAASDLGSDNTINITTGVFTGAEIGIDGGHTEVTMGSPAGGDFPYDPGLPGSFFSEFDYNPTVMGPSIIDGTRKTLTEADIAIVAQFLGFDMSTVNFEPFAVVPEPGSLLCFSIGLILFARRKRKA